MRVLIQKVSQASVTIGGNLKSQIDKGLLILLGIENEDSVTSTKEFFWLYRDEFDAHYPTHLPLRNALNLFERSRANFLGGPEAIQRLKDEHGIIFALSSINDMCKFPAGQNGESADLSPGQLVTIQTDFEVKRQGMILECHQTLLADDRPVAQASITLMTLDAETFEPTADLPEWLKVSASNVMRVIEA